VPEFRTKIYYILISNIYAIFPVHHIF
jgi:hypothetical protein